jgi:predicted dithiol-disulfide oxidoreductase (DUF899 family)
MSDQIRALEAEILEKKKRLAQLRREQEAVPVDDHLFQSENGPVRLSELFGEKTDMVLINNMGKDCAYCTLWADGFNGVVPELESRAAFVLVSADPLDVHTAFKKERGWRFTSVSDGDGAFRNAVGFSDKDGDAWPMCAGFQMRPDGTIVKVAHTGLGEGDDFCPTWHMFDLLADGWNGWEPSYRLQ